jgi:hypothetical protein
MSALFSKPKGPKPLPPPVAQVQQRDPSRRPTTPADDQQPRTGVSAGREERLGDYGSALLTG